MFFALTNALLDASIASWDAKRAFDSVRRLLPFIFSLRTNGARLGGRFKGTQTIEAVIGSLTSQSSWP